MAQVLALSAAAIHERERVVRASLAQVRVFVEGAMLHALARLRFAERSLLRHSWQCSSSAQWAQQSALLQWAAQQGRAPEG
jgi:hypothetical protein